MIERLRAGVVWTGVLLAGTWAGAALLIDGPAPGPGNGALAALVPLSIGLIVWRVPAGMRRRWLALLPAAAVALWWFQLAPRLDRDWLEDVSRTPTATLDGTRLTIRDLRHFDYRSADTDYVPRWETRSWNLDALDGMDLFISYWGPTLYGHTILSWTFRDAPPLAISIETRKERGETYSALRGFFRQFELHYVVADERDVIRVRTGFRDERVWRYRIKVSRETARALLLAYVDDMNRLAHEPVWYNALTTSCTTGILRLVQRVAPVQESLDWRILANGYLDEWLYAQGRLDTTLPFATLKAASEITAEARAAGRAEDFSTRIRARP